MIRGGVVICRDKECLNENMARKQLECSLKRNYYWLGREWPYKHVKPRIIAEEYLENGGEGLHDYKVWCFNGKVKYIQYITGRLGTHTYEAFYDINWKKQKFSYHNPLMQGEVEKPYYLNELIKCSELFANGVPFVRVDFYVLEDGSLKFGEITFFPMGGMEKWHPESMDEYFGSMIDLSYGGCV